jgi:hypothetical protein
MRITGKIVRNFIGYWAKGRAQPGALLLRAGFQFNSGLSPNLVDGSLNQR